MTVRKWIRSGGNGRQRFATETDAFEYRDSALPIDGQQIAPQVSKIRRDWIVHGVSHVGGLFAGFACAACLPFAYENASSETARLCSFLILSFA